MYQYVYSENNNVFNYRFVISLIHSPLPKETSLVTAGSWQLPKLLKLTSIPFTRLTQGRNMILWIMTPCSLIYGYQVWKNMPLFSSSTLKMETESSSETFVTTYQTTRCHNSECRNLYEWIYPHMALEINLWALTRMIFLRRKKFSGHWKMKDCLCSWYWLRCDVSRDSSFLNRPNRSRLSIHFDDP
jgi:hypothetical protein